MSKNEERFLLTRKADFSKMFFVTIITIIFLLKFRKKIAIKRSDFYISGMEER